ncbi:hypothetical protein D3C81_1064610 [compost metagenome]
MAALQPGQLLAQVGDILLALGGLLEMRVELRAARVQLGALLDHRGGFLGGAANRWRTEYVELCLQLLALRRQGGAELVGVGIQLPQGLLQVVQLGIAVGVRGLLLDAVLLGLQALEFGGGLGVGQRGRLRGGLGFRCGLCGMDGGQRNRHQVA